MAHLADRSATHIKKVEEKLAILLQAKSVMLVGVAGLLSGLLAR